MNFILWLYVYVSSTCSCSYEKVGVFSDIDSLHVVSTKLNYHLKFKGVKGETMILSKTPDSVFAVSGGWAEDGVYMFINNAKKKETIVLTTRPCIKKD